MAGVLFAHESILDWQPYKARRLGPGHRGADIDYVPQQADEKGSVQLQPANTAILHRGSGASLPMLPGMHAWSKNGDTTMPGLLLPGPLVTSMALPNVDGDAADFEEQDGDLFVFGGRYVSRVVGGTAAAVAEQDLRSAATSCSRQVRQIRAHGARRARVAAFFTDGLA